MKQNNLKDVNSLPGVPLRHYDALDLLRGVAALIVCFYHMSGLFVPHFKLFSSGFLCVDLFFLLSGFVIAASYDNKISRGLSLPRFFGDRMARLYPLFGFATLLGFAAICLQQYNKAGIIDGSRALTTLIINLFMIPSFIGPSGPVFPFNSASWSIFFEVWVNILFFIIWRQLGARFLGTLITTGALGLVVSAVTFSDLDIGWGMENFVSGFARVVFPFFFGVAIFRSKIADRWRFGARTATSVIVLLMIILNARAYLPPEWHAASDLVIVLLIFPISVSILAAAHLPPVGIRIAAVLGGISYSVYLLQLPVVILTAGATSVLLHRKVTDCAPIIGFLFMPCFLGLSYLTWRFFELPAKNWMRGLWRREGTDKTVRLKPQYDEEGVTKVAQEQGPVAGAVINDCQSLDK